MCRIPGKFPNETFFCNEKRRSIKLRPHTDCYINLKIKNAEYHQQTFSDSLMILRMVGVWGFEPQASWTRTKRDTKLRHTPVSQATV